MLLDLSKIDDNPVLYYNIAKNKEIKRTSNRYSVQNLDNDLQFEQAIWKISANKYIILGNNIKIVLENGTTSEAEGYIEIEYSDNEIVSIYNQELSYQTISSNSYIELANDIKINLGTKIVSKEDENKMSLEDMVINSDDNVTLIDLTEEEKNDEEQQEETPEEGNSTVINNQSTTSNNSQTVVTNQGTLGNLGEQNGIVDNDNDEDMELPNIKYDNSNETEVDTSKALAEPKFRFDDMEVTALSVKGTISITDDDDLLSKEDTIDIKIVNNKTGKIVYTSNEEYGILNIPVNVQTLMPDTPYTIITSATYIVDETSYTKNFIYKTFVTSKIGVNLDKDGFTDTNLNFTVSFDDELIRSVDVSLLDENGAEIPTRKQTIINNNNEDAKVSFDFLTPNTKYQIRISGIQYNGATQQGSNWTLTYNNCKTLKSRVSIDTLNYSIDKRNGAFKLYIEEVTDPDNAIENYTYIIYQYTKTQDQSGKETLDYNTEKIIYQRETTSREITVNVSSESNGQGIERDTYYGFMVIANTYDNEKYVEVASSICGPFVLSGKEFPTVKFNKEQITATSIQGTINILDSDNSIVIDESNPLIIMYKNAIGEEATYITITNPSMINMEENISIPIKLQELKAECSYTFSVYGTVDLEDGNTYKNIFIGSAIVTTNSYKELKANLTGNKTKTENDTFSVEVNLDGEKFEEESLSSVTVIMQGGSDFNPKNKSYSLTINNVNCSSYAKEGTTVTNLKDLLCDNTLKLTPSMIGGGREADYTELNYVVLVTITVDGTKYLNKIPIHCETNEDENVGTTSYTDEANEKYTAAYIIVKGKGTVADIPGDPEERNVTIKPIPNKEANQYDMYDQALSGETTVGYEVQAGFVDNGSRSAHSITYYVWDKDGNPVYDGNGNQLTYTAEFKSNRATPKGIFKLGYGTTQTLQEDDEQGMFRGGGYYFTYTVTYIDEEGNEEVWPTMVDGSLDKTSLKSETAFPNKQEPTFIMYPKTSDENSMTYIYSCHDLDKALYYAKEEEKSVLQLFADGTSQGDYNVSVNVENQEIEFTSLDKNKTYTVKYRKLLNKAQSSTYVSENLVTQKFEGVVTLGEDITYTVEYNNTKNPNKVMIELTGQQKDFNRVAGAVVKLEGENDFSVTTDFLEIKYNEETRKYYIEVDLLTLKITPDVVNKDIKTTVTLYYDSGKIGFEPEEEVTYSAYVNTTDTNYRYFTIGNGSELIEDVDNSISGNMYKYTFDKGTDKENAYLTIMKVNENSGIRIPLQYTSKGFMYKGKIIVQKEIASKEIDTSKEHKFQIDDIIVGIKVNNNIETDLTIAKIKAEIINPLEIEIEKIYIELCHLEHEGDEANWEEDNIETREIEVSDIGDFTLEDLLPASYYKMRFKYKVKNGNGEFIYMYDATDKIIKKEYEFETLATINIQNIEIQTKLESYISKYIDITYNVDEKKSSMYEKTRYEFYEYNEETKQYNKIELKDGNIYKEQENGNVHKIENGDLYVENASYKKEETFDKVNEKIDIAPTNNIFTFGKKYKLVIIPMLTYKDQQIEIEKVEKEFTLNKLADPTIAMRMLRSDEDEQNKYIVTTITINDSDKVIYGESFGNYTLKAYKYTNDNDREEVDIFTESTNGENIKSKTFDIQNNGTNYSVYLQNVDYRYNYDIELHYKLDIENKGQCEEKVEKRTLQAIDNEAGVIIGNPSAQKNSEKSNKIDINFYNSYKITDVNYIEYTLYNNNTTIQKSGVFEPQSQDWKQINEDEQTSYYSLTIPEELTESGMYIIRLNFYKKEGEQKTLAGNKEVTYQYTNEEQEP